MTAPEEQHGLGPLTKVSANFIAKSVEALTAAAELTGDTQTDTLNRAIPAAIRRASSHVRSPALG
jgi:hypothetical protein